VAYLSLLKPIFIGYKVANARAWMNHARPSRTCPEMIHEP
jgi:hypothetical protein